MDPLSIIITTVGIMVLVLLPGISLSLAIFPRKKDLDIVERIGVSVVLGLVPQFLLYFGDKNLFIPITTFTTTAAIILSTLIGLAGWQVRLKRLKK